MCSVYDEHFIGTPLLFEQIVTIELHIKLFFNSTGLFSIDMSLTKLMLTVAVPSLQLKILEK